MQTKRQIRQLLSSAGVSPNKRLGQHFLIDLNLMRLLADSAKIQKNDIVLEVGCGTGSLTEALAGKAGRIVAVELDRKLVEIAEKLLRGTENVEFINADILESKNTISNAVTDALALARKKCTGRILLVANLPYDVASPVMMNLVTGPTIADGIYVTVQKEVADRMTATPASSNYGILSIFMAATGDAKTIRILKPTVFWPQPQVDSAVVSFVRDQAKSDRIADMELFHETVSLFMGHRRKTVLACSRLARGKLAGIANWPEILEQCCIDPAQRPETLSAKDYVAIANCATKSRFLG
ncbi:MAG: 16S rRNA (adenine(1518)-N(6)/adenine(1519)-N(6))-dimethyltransferase RsmA [Phycisphaerales bacterium]|jgi:16S rRNA (adenine1518-N6/adenine1519-N6)-dimethyltransferase